MEAKPFERLETEHVGNSKRMPGTEEGIVKINRPDFGEPQHVRFGARSASFGAGGVARARPGTASGIGAGLACGTGKAGRPDSTVMNPHGKEMP
jgi:hypothetical protein